MSGRAQGRAVSGLVTVLVAASILLSGCALFSNNGALLKSGVRKLAVLPVAFEDGNGSFDCELCTPGLARTPTTADDAYLVTGFLYEALARHPGYALVDYEEVAALADGGMRSVMAQLHARGEVDAVVVGAVLSLEDRVGRALDPEAAATAALYIALIDPETDEIMWSAEYRQTDSAPGPVRRRFELLLRGQVHHWGSAHSVAEEGVTELVEAMVRRERY